MPIYPFEYPGSLIRGAKLSARNIIYTICCALKKYLEVHLHIKVQEIRKAKMGDSGLLIASKMVRIIFRLPTFYKK